MASEVRYSVDEVGERVKVFDECLMLMNFQLMDFTSSLYPFAEDFSTLTSIIIHRHRHDRDVIVCPGV